MKPNDLVQGTLGLLILRILALEPMHGWALAQRLKQMSKDVLQVGPGSLYPALHKLEQDGWISAEWVVSDTRRRVKFYSLTKEGRKQLESRQRIGSVCPEPSPPSFFLAEVSRHALV